MTTTFTEFMATQRAPIRTTNYDALVASPPGVLWFNIESGQDIDDAFAMIEAAEVVMQALERASARKH